MSANQAISHYEILGVPDHASHQDIQAAYRAGLARIKTSLDSGSPLPGSLLDQLREAYRILGDAECRQVYDQGRQAPPAAVTPAAPVKVAAAACQFTGAGGEYFRIWIVNLILTVLTLGIYSAWAKVRREQYFHRNTLLAGSGFDYHGDPRAILKGRVIAWSLFIGLSLAQKFSPALYGLLVLIAIPFMPWLLMRSLKFRAANTSFRGLRFRHQGTYRQALAAFVGHGLLVLVTFGLWLPLWMRAMKRFQVGLLSFGGTCFACEPRKRDFYGAYLAGFLLVVAVAGGVGAVLFGLAMPEKGARAGGAQVLLISMMPLLMLLLITLLVRPFMQVRLSNIVWNATTLKDCRFASNQTFRSFWPLHASNLLFIVLTLGLYWPWAKVREAAYRARRFAVAEGDLDAFIGEAGQQPSAVGEEIADVFDLDISL